MGLIKRTAGSKKFWTKEQDVELIALANEGATAEAMAEATGHPVLSVGYRIRKLSKLDSLDSIKY